MDNRSEKIASLIPAFWASLFDITVTIIHQPKEYWNGDLSSANEGNPIGQFMMSQHILGIFVISILWLLAIILLGYYLPRKLSRVFLVFVLLVHGWGAATWITRYGFLAVIAFMIFNSALFCGVDEWVAHSRKSRIFNQPS
jgi:hypothetical protein